MLPGVERYLNQCCILKLHKCVTQIPTVDATACDIFFLIFFIHYEHLNILIHFSLKLFPHIVIESNDLRIQGSIQIGKIVQHFPLYVSMDNFSRGLHTFLSGVCVRIGAELESVKNWY
jgi:hypothetical protein